MKVQSKPVIFVVISVLAVVLILGSYVSGVSAKMRPISGIACLLLPGNPGEQKVQCCQQFQDTVTRRTTTFCTDCDNTQPPSNCGPRYTLSKGGVLAPPTGNNTVTKGGVLPAPTGNNTVTLPPGNITKGPPINNNTGTLPPGSIFKVLPGTTSAFPGNNSNGTVPTLTITKEHNPASPNILNLAGNATNSSTNTGTPSTGQTQQTSGGHHPQKGGSTSSSSNTNSTGH